MTAIKLKTKSEKLKVRVTAARMACNFYLSLLVFSFSLLAHAQESDTTFHLSDVVVTGTRTPKLLKDTPIQTRLITAADIEKADATNVQDLMQQELPGVEFSYAMNQQIHLNFSGFGGQSILFLVDGERLAGETMDDVDFTRLNMAGVERIEIVKGAASALYGSNAGGGVVNIITKEATAPWTLRLNAHIARHNEQRYGGTFATRGKHLRNTLTLQHTTMDNYDVHNAPNPATRVISTIYGGKTWNVKDQLTYTPIEGLKLTGRAGYFFRQLTRTPDSPERYRDFSAGLRATYDISHLTSLDMSYSFDQYDKSDYHRLTRQDIRDYSNVQNIVRGVFHHSFAETGILTLGTDFMRDYLMNPNLEGRTRHQHSVDAFAQFDWTVSPQWEMVGAMRYDYFSDSRNARWTPKLSARYHPTLHGKVWEGSDLNLRFGYSMGFRAPTLKEKYYNFDMAGIWTVIGNPDLKAEVSHNLNLSADYTKGHYNFTAAAHYNYVQNKLTTGVPYYHPDDPTQLLLDYHNLDSYSVFGAEATLQARWTGGWSGKLSYAYTDEHLPHDKDGNTAGNQYLPARKHSLTARLDWDKQFSTHYGLRASISGRFLSQVKNVEYIDYYDIAKGTNTVHYPAYTLWKLSLTHRIGKAIRLTTAIDNLLDYRPKYHYLNSPLTDGINFMATLSVDVDKLF